MKSTTQKYPISILASIVALLTFLMLATRGNHFTVFNDLPSASTAVFFLAGMYLRSIKSFWYFYILSIVIDLSSSYMRGSFGDCLTASYPALAFSYAAMFAIGFYAKASWNQQSALFNIAKISIALFTASAIAFFISNGSYYALSGHFYPLSWAEYTARVDKYFVSSISRPIFYVASAIAIDYVISQFFSHKTSAATQPSEHL
ncbi:hypothetical protein KO495_00800 [Colwellia sp. D2M02]|uniref:Uncharacterized protein n=1 Tax=Colwellia asteriadis TaxID=517723 RepID=A0ABN1L6W5_9GAMM|nr:hypothetical protein [Colwellia sp. D2M02]MBU2891856.1 hypothetical protein [Colwellia sp. D2M02]